MENDDNTPSEIENLQASFKTFNSVVYTDVRQATFQFSDYMDTLGKVLSVPGTISAAASGTNLLLLGVRELVKFAGFSSGATVIQSARTSIENFGEEARKIDSFLSGRVERGPKIPAKPDATILDKIYSTMKDTAYGQRPNEERVGGIKDVVAAVREALTFVKKEFGKTGDDVDEYERRIELLTRFEDTVEHLSQVVPPQRQSAIERLEQELGFQRVFANNAREEVDDYVSGLSPIVSVVEAFQDLMALLDSGITSALNAGDSLGAFVRELDEYKWLIDKAASFLGTAADVFDTICWIFCDFIEWVNDWLSEMGVFDQVDKWIDDAISYVLELEIVDRLQSLIEAVVGNEFFQMFWLIVNRQELLFIALNQNEFLPEFTEATSEMGTANDFVLGDITDQSFWGGLGEDVFMGGAGDDTIDGGVGRDIAVYAGNIDNYYIARDITDGSWIISQNLPGADGYSDGTDTLINVEDVAFADEVLSLDEITGSFIRSGSTDGTSTVVIGTPLRDRIIGGEGLDRIFGREDNDVILSVANGEQTVTSNTANPIQRRGDDINGEQGDDYIQPGSLYDIIDGGPGTDTVSFFATFNYGVNISLALGNDIAVYNPTTVAFDMTVVGRAGLAGGVNVASIYRVENLEGTDFDDILIGDAGANEILGRGGNDILRGLDGVDLLNGGIGDDVLIGDDGADRLYGSAGQDLFVGGLNSDFIDGGPDRDMVLYSKDIYLPEGGSGLIFANRLERIDFENTGPVGLDLPYAIVTSNTGTNSGAEQKLTLVQKLDAAGNITGTDLLKDVENIFGTDNDDILRGSNFIEQSLFGGRGNDRIYAGVLNDREVSGTGAYGGLGEDTFYGNEGADFFSGGEDNDLVEIAGVVSLGQNDIYSGGSGIDTIDMSQSAYPWHVFFDLERNNTFVGGLEINLGSQEEEDLFYDRIFGYSMDLSRPTDISELVGGRAQTQNFETFIGSQFSDVISVGAFFDPGDTRNDLIQAFGQGGNDVMFGAQTGGILWGESGADILGTYNHTFGLGGNFERESLFDVRIITTLNGGIGDDRFVAGDAREIFDGGEDIDTLTLRDSTAGVSVNLETGEMSGGYAEGDEVRNVEWLLGSNFGDTLIGDFESNRIEGLDGADFIAGGGGRDNLFGGLGLDTLEGGEGDDVLEGGDEADVLRGGSGEDLLDGGFGDDLIDGGSENDQIRTGEGNDIVDGGDGRDTVLYDGLFADYDVFNNGTSVSVAYEGFGDTLTNVEIIQFNDLFLDLTIYPVGSSTVNGPGSGIVFITGDLLKGETLTIEAVGLTDPQGIFLATQVAQWFRDGIEIDGANQPTYTLVSDDVNTAISAEIRFTDGAGNAEAVRSAPTAPVSVINSAPTGGVTIDGRAVQGEILTADASTLDDPDGLGALSFQWLRNGTEIGGATDDSYVLVQADSAAAISVRVSYIDGCKTPEAVFSTATNPVVNTNDSPTGGVTISGTPRQGALIAANTAALRDVDGLGDLSYEWLRDGTAIVGATAAFYTLTQDDVGAGIALMVRYTDGGGVEEQVTSAATLTIENVNDAPTGALQVLGDASQGAQLTADLTSITDIDGIVPGTATYQWLRDGSIIPGAQSAVYQVVQDDIGQQISLRLGYTDLGGTIETVTSVATAAVTTENVSPSGILTITGDALERQVLVADTSQLSDPDGFGVFGYTWLRDGSQISGATGFQYQLTQQDVGAEIALRLSYVDQNGTRETVQSAATGPVQNIKDAPTGEVLILGAAVLGGTLTGIVAAVTDADGIDPASVTLQWLRGTQDIPGAGSTTYTLVTEDVGQTISLRYSFDDLGGTTEQVTSTATSPVTNDNEPVAGLLTITGEAIEGSTLTVNATGLSDPDGLGFFRYEWLRDGAPIIGANGFQYQLTDDDVGGQITLVVRFTDIGGTDETVASLPTSNVQNLNTAPVGEIVLSGAQKQGEVLQADVSGISDPDGILSGSGTYQWLRNGTPIPGATESNYALSAEDVGQQLTLRYTFLDAGDEVETVFSTPTSAIASDNSPVTGSLVISGSQTQGSTLIALANGLADLDGVGQFTYLWRKDGTPIFGEVQERYELTQADVGAAISVQVSFVDGGGALESLLSAETGPIQNVNDAASGAIILSGIVAEGQILTARLEGLSDPDGVEAAAVVLQWQLDGIDLIAQTGDTLLLTQAMVGGRISAVARYTDAQGTAEQLNSPTTAPVGNVNDLPEGAPEILGTAAEYEVLGVSLSGLTDADGYDPATVDLQWLRNGEAIEFATGTTLALGQDDIGAVINVRASFRDGQATVETVLSAGTSPVVATNRAIDGTSSAEALFGGAGDDTLFGLAGDDTLIGAGGDDLLLGGDGRDVALFSGDQSSYTIQFSPFGTVISDRRDIDGSDQLQSIEVLEFLDRDWQIASFSNVVGLSEAEFSTFVEMYIAYFNRAPDAEGLFFWANALSEGIAIETIAELFFEAPETQATYPDLTSFETFAQQVYQNVLGREFDQEGLDFWVNVLEQGAVSLGGFMLQIVRGAKAPAEAGATPEFITQKAADVAYLASKTDLGAYFSVQKGMSDVDHARLALASYDGTQSSITESVQAIDGFYSDAIAADGGEFLIQMIGILDDPFSI